MASDGLSACKCESTAGRPYPDNPTTPTGLTGGITVIGEDITDFKNAEESLRQSYEELETLNAEADELAKHFAINAAKVMEA